ncbi:MAG: hypothetical protein AB7I19_13595 [Planctomycetota bacterium]
MNNVTEKLAQIRAERVASAERIIIDAARDAAAEKRPKRLEEVEAALSTLHLDDSQFAQLVDCMRGLAAAHRARSEAPQVQAAFESARRSLVEVSAEVEDQRREGNRRLAEADAVLSAARNDLARNMECSAREFDLRRRVAAMIRPEETRQLRERLHAARMLVQRLSQNPKLNFNEEAFERLIEDSEMHNRRGDAEDLRRRRESYRLEKTIAQEQLIAAKTEVLNLENEEAATWVS